MIVRGIVHCHTRRSYDGKVGLAELCAALRREGFGFVALTEHAKGIRAEAYECFVADCRRHTSNDFVVLPGLEVPCRDGTEVAGLGLPQVVGTAMPNEVIARIRALGGYALWVHPYRHGPWKSPFPNCDGVEVLNGKLDGTLTPNLSLVRAVRRHRRNGVRFHAVFGLDLHSLDTPRAVWVECDTAALTPQGILHALQQGRFVSRTARATLPSSGRAGVLEYLRMAAWRSAWLGWGALLAAAPGPARSWLVQMSRPLVRRAKKASSKNQTSGACGGYPASRET